MTYEFDVPYTVHHMTVNWRKITKKCTGIVYFFLNLFIHRIDMFRLFIHYHQGACYMVQCKRTMYIFSRHNYLHYCSPAIILSCDKITNKILKIFCVV